MIAGIGTTIGTRIAMVALENKMGLKPSMFTKVAQINPISAQVGTERPLPLNQIAVPHD